MDIIDTHVFYEYNKLLNVNHKLKDLKEIREKYKGKHNIKFIVIPFSPEINKNIADIVKENSDFISGAYLTVIPRMDLPYWRYTPPDELATLCKREEIRGLKIHTAATGTPIDSNSLLPYIEVAKEKDIPILFHCSSTGIEYTSPNKIRNLAEKHDKLKIILAHFGGLNPDYINENLDLVKEFSNLYLNTTGMSGEIKRYELRTDKPHIKIHYTNLELREKWKEVLKNTMQDPILSNKILFGTDYPDMGYQLYPLDQLSRRKQEKILKNTTTLFKL
ncbi:MAG TPA: hypothetical protein ENG87_00100 [Candidatus Pacearchaeota archaeon]|nr:amidohydrolase [archaeon BMS3Abin17]HDK41752.1 hypothetical protein [Candidatus Pacearchaeota archaeon]HDZ61305.1 hypothetical protein [Candidatus Pacearchaeota archaeon]